MPRKTYKAIGPRVVSAVLKDYGVSKDDFGSGKFLPLTRALISYTLARHAGIKLDAVAFHAGYTNRSSVHDAIERLESGMYDEAVRGTGTAKDYCEVVWNTVKGGGG